MIAQPTDVRELFLRRLREDLMGPLAKDEVLSDRPGDRYLTGILSPQKLATAQEEDEEASVGDDDEEGGAGRESVSFSRSVRPSTCGISFALKALGTDPPHVRLVAEFGTYIRFEVDEEGNERKEPTGQRQFERWRRVDHRVEIPNVAIMPDMKPIRLSEHGGPDGVEFCFRVSPYKGLWTVTIALVNTNPSGDTRVENEEASLFQTGFTVKPERGCELAPRPSRHKGLDEDSKSASLIYRNTFEYAVGHTCAGIWDRDRTPAAWVATSWIPESIVPATSPEGDSCFAPLRSATGEQPFSAAWLAEADQSALTKALEMIPTAYETWLNDQEKRIPSLDRDLQEQAQEHIKICREGAKRMRQAVQLLGQDDAAYTAFRLANKAMLLQRTWSTGDAELHWRPFQIGFQLLSLCSIAKRDHPDRNVMDLLWFPTGGGKTEAYLALMAFTMFYRRISDGPDRGAGVAVLTRYTLRLLTIQQFQRAAALVCACELMRRGLERPRGVNVPFGSRPFSIGLWVGGNATPNTVAQTRNLNGDAEPTPRQLTACPVCGGDVRWEREKDNVICHCLNDQCAFGGSDDGTLPVSTVDEIIYRDCPSVVIGTVDKFAQIVRNPSNTGRLFGIGTPHLPPDLIIQDELHLISGPLGTVTGLYELVIDELCSAGATRPKVIGSTATIRRARNQIRALFNRDTYQFPPPVIDWENSCFAVKDDTRPGRSYVGITTVGRSPKYTLQAVYASLLQSAACNDIPHELRDLYWTLVGYFNSLRELGGALVLIHDDVAMSLKEYAKRRGEPPRVITVPEELTSRRSSAEIPNVLSDLKKTAGEVGAYDVLLASNMISVGVDVPRLSLMVVNGQPKQVAEYIQATSRVGRDQPGLIAVIYNNGKVRDRSHFETFSTWHQSLYRDVEATSVTPFASRSLDKALHAVLVALVRQRVDGMRNQPKLASLHNPELDEVIRAIKERCRSIDPSEEAKVATKLNELLLQWHARSGLQVYWEDYKPDIQSLLMSAEQHAARQAVGARTGLAWPTPNSMREVEPGTPFVLVERLRSLRE